MFRVDLFYLIDSTGILCIQWHSGHFRHLHIEAIVFRIIVHLFFMGVKGWLYPGGWHGGLPPISLVAFVFFATGYLVNLLGRK